MVVQARSKVVAGCPRCGGRMEWQRFHNAMACLCGHVDYGTLDLSTEYLSVHDGGGMAATTVLSRSIPKYQGDTGSLARESATKEILIPMNYGFHHSPPEVCLWPYCDRRERKEAGMKNVRIKGLTCDSDHPGCCGRDLRGVYCRFHARVFCEAWSASTGLNIDATKWPDIHLREFWGYVRIQYDQSSGRKDIHIGRAMRIDLPALFGMHSQDLRRLRRTFKKLTGLKLHRWEEAIEEDRRG